MALPDGFLPQAHNHTLVLEILSSILAWLFTPSLALLLFQMLHLDPLASDAAGFACTFTGVETSVTFISGVLCVLGKKEASFTTSVPECPLCTGLCCWLHFCAFGAVLTALF